MLAALLSWLGAKGQDFGTVAKDGGETVRMQPLIAYEESLRSYYLRMMEVGRAEYRDMRKGQGWDLVPSVGVTLGMPQISLNTGQIANYIQKRTLVRQKMEAMGLDYKLKYNQALAALRAAYADAGVSGDELVLLREELATREKIFAIHQEAYEKNELKPEAYYERLLVIQQARRQMKQAETAHRQALRGLEEKAKWGIGDEELQNGYLGKGF